MKKCRMISIDSSTKRSAYAVFDNGNYISSELIDCQEKILEKRFKNMALLLINSIAKLNPDIIYIEDTVVPRNAQTQRFLTRLQGVIYGYCILNNCEFNSIRPTEWRKLVGIDQGRKKREDLKQLAIEMVKKKFDLDVNDDEAEAVLIGVAAIKKFNP